MNLNLVLLIIIIITDGILPLIQKTLTKYSLIGSLILNRELLFLFYILCYFIYLKINNKKIPFTRFSFKYFLLLLLLCAVLFSYLNLILFLIKINSLSFYLPQSEIIKVILSIILGYFIFNEKINKEQMKGVFLIIIGLIIYYNIPILSHQFKI